MGLGQLKNIGYKAIPVGVATAIAVRILFKILVQTKAVFAF